MNCDRALELLLEAEPAELTLMSETPLVAHLRTCATCSAIASQLSMQATAIASVVSRGRAASADRSATARRPARAWRWAPVGLAMAAVLVTLVSRSREGIDTIGSAASQQVPDRIPGATSATMNGKSVKPEPGPVAAIAPSQVSGRAEAATVLAEAQPASPPKSPAAGLASARRYEPEPMTAVAFESVPVDAAPARAGSVADERNVGGVGVISVAPPPGTQATVMRTSDPNVTVVWLQPADTTRVPR